MVSLAPSSRIHHIASSPEFLILQASRNNRHVSLRSSVAENNGPDLVIYNSLELDTCGDNIGLAGVGIGANSGATLLASAPPPIVGPNWNGETPSGISGVVRSTTNFAATMLRIFLNDTP
jgi:hypothetical protein